MIIPSLETTSFYQTGVLVSLQPAGKVGEYKRNYRCTLYREKTEISIYSVEKCFLRLNTDTNISDTYTCEILDILQLWPLCV